MRFFEWCEATMIGTVLRESTWLFAFFTSAHLAAIATMFGAVFIVDSRLLGLGLRDANVATLASSMHPWFAWSVIAVVATGIPLFLSEAVRCFESPPFWWKISLLTTGIIFTLTVRKRALQRWSESGPGKGCLIAIVSMSIWTSAVFCGKWIGYY